MLARTQIATNIANELRNKMKHKQIFVCTHHQNIPWWLTWKDLSRNIYYLQKAVCRNCARTAGCMMQCFHVVVVFVVYQLHCLLLTCPVEFQEIIIFAMVLQVMKWRKPRTKMRHNIQLVEKLSFWKSTKSVKTKLNTTG